MQVKRLAGPQDRRTARPQDCRTARQRPQGVRPRPQGARPLQLSEKGHRYIDYHVLIEPVNADYHPAVLADLDQFTGKSDK